MKKMDDSIKLAWEKRSKFYHNKPEGVLPKSLPTLVNKYLDNWMYEEVSSKLKTKNSNLKILDLGCGYGRLSEHILRDFPKVETFGIDVASNYVNLYNKNLGPRGKAVAGDIRRLPFRDNFFDNVFMVTTLMYIVVKMDQKRAMKEIFRVLKPSGSFVIIERNTVGQKIVTLGGMVSKVRGKANKEIDSVSFARNSLVRLIESAGGDISRVEGLPIWTLSLPFSFAANLVNKTLCKVFLQLIKLLDKIFSWLLTPSLYISYSGIKKKFKNDKNR